MNHSRLDVLRGHYAVADREHDVTKRTQQCACVAIAPTREVAEYLAAASPICAGHAAAQIGTPAQLVARIEVSVVLGDSHLQIRFADFPRTDGIRLFIDAVLPHFAQAAWRTNP